MGDWKENLGSDRDAFDQRLHQPGRELLIGHRQRAAAEKVSIEDILKAGTEQQVSDAYGHQLWIDAAQALFRGDIGGYSLTGGLRPGLLIAHPLPVSCQ